MREQGRDCHLGGVRSAARREDVRATKALHDDAAQSWSRTRSGSTRGPRRGSSTWRRDSRRRSASARDTKVMDGKSIMGILLLAAARGTTLTISADGPDEASAVDALVELVESGFGEESWNA